MSTLPEEAVPTARPESSEIVVNCDGRCGRRLRKPRDAQGRIILCKSCWTSLLHTVLKLIRVVKEEV